MVLGAYGSYHELARRVVTDEAHGVVAGAGEGKKYGGEETESHWVQASARDWGDTGAKQVSRYVGRVRGKYAEGAGEEKTCRVIGDGASVRADEGITPESV